MKYKFVALLMFNSLLCIKNKTSEQLKSDGRLCLVAAGLTGGLNVAWYGFNAKLIVVDVSDTNLFIARVKEFYKNVKLLVKEGKLGQDSDSSSGNENLKNYDIGENKDVKPKELVVIKSVSAGKSSTELVNIDKKCTDEMSIEQKDVEEKELDILLDFLGCAGSTKDYYAGEKLLVETSLKYREQCRLIHKNSPDTFLMGVYSDDINSAYKKILRQMTLTYNDMKRSLQSDSRMNIRKDKAYKKIVGSNMKKLIKSFTLPEPSCMEPFTLND